MGKKGGGGAGGGGGKGGGGAGGGGKGTVAQDASLVGGKAAPRQKGGSKAKANANPHTNTPPSRPTVDITKIHGGGGGDLGGLVRMKGGTRVSSPIPNLNSHSNSTCHHTC
jgi:hypothetical protein